MPDLVHLKLNGREVAAPAGTTVAVAIANAGIAHTHRSVTGQPRDPLCGMGVCFECRATINGQPHQRTCNVLVAGNMDVIGGTGIPVGLRMDDPGTCLSPRDHPAAAASTTHDIAIIGAGPAGLSAAWAATQSGSTVCLFDDNPAPGGQIWRGESPRATTADSERWLARFAELNCPRLLNTSVIAHPRPGLLLAEQAGHPMEIRYRKLILATGARERFLPFPGWTSPRILGVGGLQAMVKSGLDVAGKRVIVAGSGPLLLPAAATLRKHGATILRIVEQAPLKNLLRFGLSLLTSLTKVRQALSFQWQLLGIPYHPSAWPTRAHDTGHELQVEIVTPSGPIIEHCDYLACGFFLVPQLELSRLFGCAVNNGCVTVNDLQQSSIPDIFCAGEITGIGGLEKSLIEGQIAGHAAAGNIAAAQLLFGQRRKSRHFAHNLRRAFQLRSELRTLPDDQTIVCRCEDVRLEDLRLFASFRDAKLQTRCGMGACQGRTCGSACETLFGWTDTSVRPPVVACRVGSLAGAAT